MPFRSSMALFSTSNLSPCTTNCFLSSASVVSAWCCAAAASALSCSRMAASCCRLASASWPSRSLALTAASKYFCCSSNLPSKSESRARKLSLSSRDFFRASACSSRWTEMPSIFAVTSARLACSSCSIFLFCFCSCRQSSCSLSFAVVSLASLSRRYRFSSVIRLFLASRTAARVLDRSSSSRVALWTKARCCSSGVPVRELPRVFLVASSRLASRPRASSSAACVFGGAAALPSALSPLER
mmetsp:Transcript_59410/g.134483  ORF Transcript_59410/g.134483 Transcript_59410/m.134483 type:complete len:243 (-) Transcript_59410:31-759(-)